MKKEVIFCIIMMVLFDAGLSSCKKGENLSASGSSRDYFVSVWNEMAPHRLNPSDDKQIILQPNNNLIVRVVKRGNPPKSGTTGITASYELTNYKSSENKDSGEGFLAKAIHLFGSAPIKDKTSEVSALSIKMNDVKGLFMAEGIQGIPFYHNGNCNKYQTAVITVKTSEAGLIANAQVTIPAYDEINCTKCHGSATVSAFNDILAKHNLKHNTALSLPANQPVQCAGCHPGSISASTSGSNTNLSKALHGSHANITDIHCHDCHIGISKNNNGNFSVKADNSDCVGCHGKMATISSGIVSAHVPDALQPPCETCHTGLKWTHPGEIFYGKPRGNGRPFCFACHKSRV